MTDITFKDNRLRELRTNYPEKLTQEKLAKIIGVTKRTIIAWEKNERDITPDKAKKLANHFGVDVAYLLGYQEERYLFKDTVTDEPVSEIQSLYDKLNNDNQGKLLDYGHLLLRDQQKTKFDNISDESIKKVRSSGNKAHQRIMDRIENQRRKNEKR
ncbi:helix-turn-helix transcriptional regulator [Streptococcus pluranimalium]|uniref:HTH cro/C1-type domain-containing protein n=1 Tax=Streptococcus pluranimalium TaxID=82348 RepID=A0A345VLR9_9STRE|nr:helix-turn-helix transcriptional regulator [Streptococcus pluranimalium]AXJ13671.1 hypothetical protein Sp14A_17640 [Streptococcus pluranimalium]